MGKDFGAAPFGPSSIDSPIAAAGGVEVAVFIEADAVGAFSIGCKGLSSAGIFRIEIARANPQYLLESAGGEIEIAGLVENDAGNIGADFLAANVALLHPSDYDELGIFRIDAPNVAADAIASVEIAAMIGGDAFDDDRLFSALGIEVDQHGSARGLGFVGADQAH